MESEQHLLNLISGRSTNEVAKSIGDQIADGILRRIESSWSPGRFHSSPRAELARAPHLE